MFASPTDPTMIFGTPGAEKFMDTGKNPKKMKKQNLTPPQKTFFKEMEQTIDSDLAKLLSDYTPEEIMRAKFVIISDEKQLTLTIKVEIPTA